MSMVRVIGSRLTGAWQALAGRTPVSYAGGRSSRRDAEFHPMAVGPNMLSDQTLGLLRRRCRWLDDNHPLVAGAKQTIQDNVVGQDGIGVHPNTPWPELNKDIADRWWQFCEAVDMTRTHSLAEDQRLFMGEVFSGGDVLVHRPISEPFDRRPAGVASELLPAEQLDESVMRPLSGGSVIRQGVELDAKRRPVAYHVFAALPSDGWMEAQKTVRVPIDRARLAFIRRRPGQLRGVPAIVASLMLIRMEDGLQDATLQLALLAACIGLYFEGTPPPAAQKLVKGLHSGDAWGVDGEPLTAIRPGLIGYHRQGGGPKMLSPSQPGPQFVPLAEHIARQMGKGLGMGYADFSGDDTKTNFAASRAESLKGRKRYRPLQVMVMERHTLPLYRDFIRAEIASGAIKLDAPQREAWLHEPHKLFAHIPIYPGWEWVNPQQEAQAASIEIGLNIRSPIEVVGQRGKHWHDVIDEGIAWEKYELEARKKAGLGPRAVAAAPGAVPGRDADEDEDGDEKKADKRPQEAAA